MCDPGIEIPLPTAPPLAFNPDSNNNSYVANRKNKFCFFKNKRTLVSTFISIILLISTIVFAGFYFRNFILSLFIVIISMFICDLVIGFHNTMIFTYSSLNIPITLSVPSSNT